MTPERFSQFLRDELPTFCPDEMRDDSGYALPAASLAVLRECVTRLGIQRVFEFGSGRSTRGFLDAGCTVTAIEDSETWLSETLATLTPEQRERFKPVFLPLERVWLAGAPFQSWRLPEAVLADLCQAELVLVDSPALPPFREHALALALEHARGALIVVDDARIPTVSRFCQRLATRNGAAHHFSRTDHGLFICGPATRQPFCAARSWIETAKAWRRYLLPRAGA